MNLRLTLTAAVAVILASVSIYPLIQTAGWFWAGVGAVITVAIAGIVTRLPTLQASAAGSVITLVAVLPLLLFPDWGLKVPGLLIIAVTAASHPRLRLLQALSWVIVYLAALLIYLNAVLAARLSTAVIVPTWASVSYLSALVSQGMAEWHSEPPVPSVRGVIFLAAAGIGLMAAATDLLAVRLRSPAIAGLPLLALYCVRITTSARQGGVGATVVFCLTLIGYLALLAADGRERLRVWGRLVTVWHGSSAEPDEPRAERPDTRALAASGRHIGLAAACIALASPLLVPGITVHDLFQSGGSDTGPGGNRINLPYPLVQMQDQLRESAPQTVLTFTTTSRDPRERYLQVYVLNYDSDTGTWNLVPPRASTPVGSGQLRAAPGVARGTPEITSSTKVKLATGVTGYSSKLAVLPLPYAPAKLRVSGSRQEDDATLMVYSTGQQLSGLSYTVTSTQPNPGSRELDLAPSYPQSISSSYLGFPAGPHNELAKLTARITKGLRTPIQKGQALENYFTSAPFTYSLNVNLPDNIDGLTTFLFQTQKGYCQQFAFAMAALARLAGIPSRIAVGYTAGTYAGKGTWKVTTADAHAWPELYIRDVGWLRFEPTPGGAAGTATEPDYQGPPGTGAIVPPGPTTGPSAGAKPGSGASGPNPAHIRRPGIGAAGSATSRAIPGHSIVFWILQILVILLALFPITPLTVRSLIRHRRLQTAGDAGFAHAAWRELRDNLADYRLTGRPSESPRATAARIAATLHLDPAARQALARIVSAEERARYATAPLASQPLRADTTTVRRALARQAGWPRRWRARLLPASMLTPLRPALKHALDVLG